MSMASRYGQNLTPNEQTVAPILPECYRVSLTGPGPLDPKQNGIGEKAEDSVKETMSSLAILPFTKILNMPINEAHALIEHAAVDATTVGLKPYFSL